MPLEPRHQDIRAGDVDAREDPLNKLLEVFRVQIDAAKALGLEAQMWAIVEAEFPREPAAAPPVPVKAAEYSIERELRASRAHLALKDLEHAIRSPARKALIEPIREIVDEEVAALRAARTWEQGE